MIQNSAMLAALTICKWSAVKNDKAASALVETTNNAHNAGHYSKKLVDKQHLAAINTLSNDVRSYHYARTYAWGDNGQRLLPSALFMDYRDTMVFYKDRFNRAVDDFIAQYPSIVQTARTRLGSMYDPLDYPDISDVRDKFSLNIEITPVPDGDDFRVAVSQEARDELRAEITKSINARIHDATDQCWSRIRAAVALIANICSNEKVRIHDSVMSNTENLLSLLPGLNFTNDPLITSIAADVQKLITPTETLRMSPDARATLGLQAKQVLARIEART